MASIRAYETAKGERRYEVRYRENGTRDRSRVFSVHRDARAFKLDVERRHQAGVLYQAPPERFGVVAQAWLDRFVSGAAGRVRPRPRTIRIAEDCLSALVPLNDLSLERLRRAVVEDHIATIAERAPRRAEMALSLLKRILRDAEERGQMVNPSVHRIRIAKAEEREPRFLTWAEVEELRSWVPEYVARVIPVAVLTMLRRGEVFSLRDVDVDLDAGSIAVFAQRQDGAARRHQDPRRPPARGRRPAGRPPPSRAAARPRPEPRRLPLPHPRWHALRRRQLHVARLQAGGARGRASPSSPSTTSATPARR